MKKISKEIFDELSSQNGILQEIDKKIREAPLRVMIHNKSNRVARFVLDIRKRDEERRRKK